MLEISKLKQKNKRLRLPDENLLLKRVNAALPESIQKQGKILKYRKRSSTTTEEGCKNKDSAKLTSNIIEAIAVTSVETTATAGVTAKVSMSAADTYPITSIQKYFKDERRTSKVRYRSEKNIR